MKALGPPQQAQRDRDRQTDRQRDRQTDRETDRQTDRQTVCLCVSLWRGIYPAVS